MFKAFSLVKFLIPQEQAVGICLDGSEIRKAFLRASGSSISIEKLEILTENTNKNAIFATCIDSTKTIARSIEIALTKQKDIDATFSFEAESHLPYPLEDCFIDKIALGQSNGSTNLQLFSILKSDAISHLETLNEHSIDPEVLCPKPLALCHFVQRLYMATGIQIALHVDRQETTCVLIQDGLPLMARSHPVGLDTLEAVTYVNDEGQTSINENELENLQHYLREISRILLAFQNEFDTSELPILFCGPLVENQILMDLFTSALERTIAPTPETFSQKSYSKNYSWQELLIFAIPIGCALSVALEQKGKSINFRKDEIAYPDKWRRWKKELVLYFLLMSLLSGGGFIYGKASLKEQQASLIEQYATLLQVMEKPTSDEALLAMSPDEINDSLYDLENELKSGADEMALHPDVPRVSDLLAWISSHPNVTVKGDDDKTLALQSLSYNMVKRPEKGKTKERYQVRVDLEFSSPSPTMARELHDALLAPNDFIDPKNELKWSVHRGNFKASFFLKDRTKYPQQLKGASL